MSAKLISNENNKAVYELEISWEDFYQATEKVYRAMKSKVQIAGFRKGHAPRKIIEANYGKEVFYEDALNDILPDAIRDAVKALELEPIGKPDIEEVKLEEGQPVLFKVETELRPHPVLADFKGMEVERVKINVSEEEIQSVLSSEQDKNAVLRPVEDRPVKEKDIVRIDYVGTIDGEAFEGGSQEGAQLTIGAHQFIPGFEEQIVGHSAGEEFDLSVTFPQGYQAHELAGKDAIFHIKLHEIHEKDLPELNDEFAQDVSEFDTLEEYREDIRKKLTEEREEQAKSALETAAVRKLVEISGIEPPKSMIETEIDHSMSGLLSQLSSMGLTLDQYLQYIDSDLETVRKQFEPMAQLKISGDLALQSLVEQEKIDATEEEVDQEIKTMAERYGAKDLEDFIQKVHESGDSPYFKETLLKKKALDFLMEQIRPVDPPEPAEEKKAEESGQPEETEKPEESVEE